MAFDVGTATAFLKLDISNFISGVIQAQQQVKGLGTSLGAEMMRNGMSMVATGQLMTSAFTMPVVNGFTSVIKSAADLEESLTNVRKTTDASDEEYAALVEWAQNLSTEIPVAATKLLDIGEIIGQMGVQLGNNREEFQKYIEVAAKLAYTTNLTEEAASNFIGRFSTLMKVTGDDVDALGATLVDLGNKYNGTESEIAALALRLTGAASVVNMSAQGVLGLSAAMVNVGLTAETGGSSMSRFLENVDEAVHEGGEKLTSFAELAGVTSDQFVKAWRDNPEEAILSLIANMSRVQQEGGSVYEILDMLDIGTIRYKDTVLRLTSATEASNKAMGDANEAWVRADALEVEAAKRKEDFNAQLEMTKNAWEEIKVTIGEAFLPVLKELMLQLRDWFETIKDKINPELVIMVAKILGVIAVIGPLVTAIGSVITVLGVLLSPVGLVIGLIGVMVYSISELIKINEESRVSWEHAVKGIEPFEEAVSRLSPKLTNITDLLSTTGKTVTELNKQIKDAEDGITKIYATALAEHRGLRQDELDNIREYNKQLLELQAEKLQLYRDQQLAELKKLQLEENTLTQEQAEQRIANAKYAFDQANQVVEDAYTKQLTMVENKHKALGTIGSDAYQRDLITAKTYYDVGLRENKTYLAETYTAVAEAAQRWLTEDMTKWRELNKNNYASWQEYQTVSDRMFADYAEAFLSMVVTAKKYGATLSDDMKATMTRLLNTVTDERANMDGAGKELILGLIQGIDDEIPGLEKAANMSAEEIVATIKTALGIQSPSTVMAEIGGNVVAGLYEGIDKNKDWLRERLSIWSGDVISWIKGVFGIKSPSSIMRDSVGKQLVLGIAEGITGNSGVIEKAMAGLLPILTDGNLAIEMTKGLASHGNAFAPKADRKLAIDGFTDAKSSMTASGGNTYIFNSPKALDPVTAKRQFDTAQKQQSLLFDIG